MIADAAVVLSSFLAPTFLAAVVSAIFLWWKTRRDEAVAVMREAQEAEKQHNEVGIDRDRLRLDVMGEVNTRLTAENVRMNNELATLRTEIDNLRDTVIPGLYKRIVELERSERDLKRRLAVYENA